MVGFRCVHVLGPGHPLGVGRRVAAAAEHSHEKRRRRRGGVVVARAERDGVEGAGVGKDAVEVLLRRESRARVLLVLAAHEPREFAALEERIVLYTWRPRPSLFPVVPRQAEARLVRLRALGAARAPHACLRVRV